jgi:glycosyltransferase 2 family protein
VAAAPIDVPVGKRLLQPLAVVAALAGVCYLASALWAGRSDVLAAFKSISILTFASLLVLSAVNYGLRFVRWHYYLWALGARVPVRENLRIYIGGFALTTTPGKAGELARTLWLQPFGVAPRASVAAFFAERVQDFIAITLLSCLGLSLYPHARTLVAIAATFVAAVLAVLLVPGIAAVCLGWSRDRRGRIAGVAQKLLDVLMLARACMTPPRFVAGLLLGLFAWAAEAMAMVILVHALALPLPASAAVAVYALAMLAGGLSFMPGGLGGSEAAMIFALRLSGIALSAAVSVTLIIRLTTLWFAVLLGALALSAGGASRGRHDRAISPDMNPNRF